MSALVFPSKEWCQRVASVLHPDPTVQAAARDFGPVTAGCVIERGDGLKRDFCVLLEAGPDMAPKLTFCDDEDELEELEPDYMVWIAHKLARELLEATLRGERPDPLPLVTSGKVKFKGDLARVMKVAPKHADAGLASFRTIATTFLR
ncbi:MAG: hypothetical protein JST92_17660 [Deltaproteobacteria bacterium]|nr:hypothetical protein [Deltaproteobacteria bacterium]